MKVIVRYQDGKEGVIEIGSAKEEKNRLEKSMNEIGKIFKEYTGRELNPKEIKVVWGLLTDEYDNRQAEIISVIGYYESNEESDISEKSEKSSYYTITDISERLNVNPETVRRWVRNGKLKVKISGSRKEGFKISETSYRNFIKNNPKYFKED